MGNGKETITELILELTEPDIREIDGTRRAVANGRLWYVPAAGQGRREMDTRFRFIAPMGIIEKRELRWYLEDYHAWPSTVFQQRAQKLEKKLPLWGKDLYDAVFKQGECAQVLFSWQEAVHNGSQRFTLYVDKTLPGSGETGNGDEVKAAEAATMLLTLPWELMHDDTGYLFKGGSPVQVRRRLPNRKPVPPMKAEPPIRVLMVSPRPEDEKAKYIDHRISALPLVSALETLGEAAQLTVLVPPTFDALGETLLEAKDAGKPFHVVHFDGHGIYDKKVGMGGLCFEDPNETNKLEKRESKLIMADDIAGMMRDYRIPLVFLEACQSAQSEKEPGASVAATLLNQGVASVVAMSHSVLVETAKRFVTVFYKKLA